MNRIIFIYLVLFFTSIAHITHADDDDDEGGGGEEESKPKGKGGGGGGGGGGGAQDTKCQCCAGHGVKCGQRLKYCGGGDDCHKNKLYYCDPKTKKAYIYETCKHRCLMDEDDSYPDFCAITYDNDFMYIKEDNIKKWRQNFNKTFEEYMKKFKKFEEKWDIKPPSEEEMKIIGGYDDDGDDDDEEDEKEDHKGDEDHKENEVEHGEE